MNKVMRSSGQSILLTGTILPPLFLLNDMLSVANIVQVKRDSADLRNAIKELGTAPDGLVVGLYGTDQSSDTLANAFWLIESIQLCRQSSGRLPRYAIGLLPKTEAVDAVVVKAALGSLTRYITSHLLYEDISINLISYVDTALGQKRAADAAWALMSGMLDTVRGQTLNITDE
jgi:hypothetical protein